MYDNNNIIDKLDGAVKKDGSEKGDSLTNNTSSKNNCDRIFLNPLLII